MNKERILALADLIEVQPHTTFEAEIGFSMDNWSHSCGTPSCIAGWACAMEKPIDARPISERSLWHARDYLGLSAEQADALFEPDLRDDEQREDNDHLAVTDLWDAITPSQAADTLRRLAETGEVVWSAA